MPEQKSLLVVVHGMGEQERNTSLVGVMRPAIGLMERRGGVQGWRPEITGSLAVDRPAYAELEFGGRTWAFTEYWWAQEFVPPRAWSVSFWILNRLFAHFRSILRSLWQAGADLGGEDPWLARVYHFIAAPVFTALTLALMLATPWLVLALVVLGYVSRLPGVPAVIKSAKSVLELVALDYLGDIYVYLQHPVQRAQIRGGFEEMLDRFAADAQVDRIVILAHSTGNLVVYDALAHMNASAGDHGPALEKVKAVIGIGSILPMAWNRKIVDPEQDARFHIPAPPGIHWYHLWTRYDVGPAGPLEHRLPEGYETISAACLADRRVSNAEDLAQDHTGYWDNEEQVHSLALEEMGGLNPGNPFWRGPGRRADPATGERWKSRSEQAWADYNMRRKLTAELATVRLLSHLVFPVSLAYLLFFTDRMHTMAGWLQFDHIGGWINWRWLERANDPGEFSGLSEIGLAALVAFVVFVVANVVVFQLLFKKGAWLPLLRRKRAARDRAFLRWRNGLDAERAAWEQAGRPAAWPLPEDN